uniref:Alpha-galactosidase n=1 Tax=Tanacetum cinerariifolium TaxID=118510 RepID=A0A6L2L7G0_TANCI|nr:epoxide hydrolase [Tanacetum cinerariifolium]
MRCCVTIVADLNDKWPAYVSPGGWNDPDMLTVSNGVMTYPEYKSHFNIRPLMKNPPQIPSPEEVKPVELDAEIEVANPRVDAAMKTTFKDTTYTERFGGDFNVLNVVNSCMSFAEKVESLKQDPNELKVEAPTLFIMGEKDYVFKFPGMEEYLKSGEVKNYVQPGLKLYTCLKVPIFSRTVI